jgi:hypothetical protein
MKRAVVRAKPGLAAPIVTTLPTGTTDDTQNIVLVLARVDISPRQSWYKVRLPILPNNKIGYVQPRYLSSLFVVHTHLYVNRGSMTATLKRDGKAVFKTRVGIGKSYWPTPRGEFYIRDKLTNFNNPVLWAGCVRDERALAHPDRLAGWRLCRRSRNEPAADHPRAHLARLHPHAQPGHPRAGPADARRDSADD